MKKQKTILLMLCIALTFFSILAFTPGKISLIDDAVLTNTVIDRLFYLNLLDLYIGY